MSLSSTHDIVMGYLQRVGMLNHADSGRLYRKIEKMVPPIISSHAKRYPWEWIEKAEETLASGSNPYVTPSTIEDVEGAVLETPNASTGQGDLIFIDYGLYKIWNAKDSDTTTYPKYASPHDGKLYLYKNPADTLSVVVYGKMDTDVANLSTILGAIPTGHEQAIMLFIDANLGVGKREEYDAAALMLWKKDNNYKKRT